ncbi:MAG: AMP-binding protein, partial [Rhizobiaceae bacterium]
MANALHDRLFAPQARNDAPFLWLPDGRILSHSGFFALTGRFAAALAQRGVMAGDRVAAQTRKSAEALALYAACVRLGAIYLPLNTAYTPAEIAYFVNDAEPRLLVADQAALA